MTNLTSNALSQVAKKLSDLSNINLELLNGTCQQKDEVQDYYLGILRKQAIVLSDISKILEDRDIQYITSQFILLRSLMKLPAASSGVS